MAQATTLQVKGLKCDAPGCDYVDPEAVFSKKYLNAPCPKCGAPLLTRADYTVVRTLQLVSKLINKFVGPIPGNAERVHIPLALDGKGNLSVRQEEN